MRPLPTASPSYHGHGMSWRDDAVRQGLVSDPRAIRLVAYYPQLAPLVGGHTPALLLCQLLFWTGRQRNPEGWIYKEQAEWSAETGLSRRAQEGARQKLRARGLLEECYGHFPRRLYYRVNLNALGDAWRASYHTPAPTSTAGPPRPPLAPVTTDPAATMAVEPEPPSQTAMLLDYPTPTGMEPPSKPIAIRHESARMGDAVSPLNGAVIDPTTDRSPDPFALPKTSKNLNEITLMDETAVQQGGTVHYETSKNHNNFDEIHHGAHGNNDRKKKKGCCVHARGTPQPPRAVPTPQPTRRVLTHENLRRLRRRQVRHPSLSRHWRPTP